MPDPSRPSGSPRARRGVIGHHTSARACRRCVSRRLASTRSSKSSRSISKTDGGSWWRRDARGRRHASGARRIQGGEPAGAVHGAAAAGAGAGRHHARSSGRIRPPRCLARPAVCDAHVEAATRLQPHGYPDARPRDWRDDGHVQRGQRSGHQAPSLSRIRERRDGWRLGSIWKRA